MVQSKTCKSPRVGGVVLTLLLMIAGTGAMHASAVVGSLPLAGFGATQNGANLTLSTMLADKGNFVTDPGGTLDYSVIPAFPPTFTDYGPFSLDLTTIGTGGGFTLTNATYGAFTASSGTIVMVDVNFLNVDLLGTYTPGPGMPAGVTAGPTSVSVAFTQRGSSLSVSETLVSIPTIPETGTLALFGSGIVGVAGILRIKSNR
jgi:hypothetical protein